MVQTAFQEAQHALDDDPDYRPMSGLAVAGFLMSLGSVAAFFGAVLWTVAGLAVALCIAGVYHVNSTDPPRAGGRLARIGLALSLFCLVTAMSYDMSYRWRLRQQGHRVAAQWMDALNNNRLVEAHQLTLPAQTRNPHIKKLNQLYKNDLLLATGLKRFENSDSIKRFLALEDRQVKLRHAGPPVRNQEDEGIEFVYDVQGHKQDGTRDVFVLKCDITRHTSQASSIAGWRVNLPLAEDPEDEKDKSK